MKSIETSFLHKILLSAIFLGFLGSSVQSALVPVSKDLVPVKQGDDKGTEKQELIKRLEVLKPEIAKLLAAKDEQVQLEKEVLKLPRSLSGMWRYTKNNSVSLARSVWNKAKSITKGIGDTACIGLMAGTAGMSGAILSHWSLISPSWLCDMDIHAWPAAYTSFMLGALGTCAYYMWQHTPSSKYSAAHNVLLDLCQELGIPVDGLSIAEGDGNNKICSRIYASYKSDASSDEKRSLIKALLLDAQADKDVVSNAFTKYRSQIDGALKKLKDVVAVEELRDNSFKLAAVLCKIREKMVKINTDFNAVK